MTRRKWPFPPALFALAALQLITTAPSGGEPARERAATRLASPAESPAQEPARVVTETRTFWHFLPTPLGLTPRVGLAILFVVVVVATLHATLQARRVVGFVLPLSRAPPAHS